MDDLVLNITNDERRFLLKCIHMASLERFYEMSEDTPINLNELLDKFEASKQFREYVKRGVLLSN